LKGHGSLAGWCGEKEEGHPATSLFGANSVREYFGCEITMDTRQNETLAGEASEVCEELSRLETVRDAAANGANVWGFGELQLPVRKRFSLSAVLDSTEI
jgi:hypothetical protein